MKKLTVNKTLFIIFILILVLPFPLFFAFGKYFDNENREKRDLAEMPTSNVAISKLPAAFEDFLNDHAAFREPIMRLNATINYKVFGCINSETVLLGKENWLFYKNTSDSKSLDDYQGINRFTAEQTGEIISNLTLLRNNLAKHNIDFAVLTVPNKEKIYSNYMPSFLPVINANGRVETLFAAVSSATDIKFLYPKAELLAAASSAQVYYKYDTHWNDIGAIIGTKSLITATNATEHLFNTNMAQENGSAAIKDLADIASIYLLATDDKDYAAPSYAKDAVATHLSSTSDGYYSKFACDNGKGRLLMLRDSFGEKAIPYLAKSYEKSTFVHINSFTSDTLQDEKPTVFVFELAERNLDRMIDYLPKLVEWSAGLH